MSEELALEIKIRIVIIYALMFAVFALHAFGLDYISAPLVGSATSFMLSSVFRIEQAIEK